MPKSGTGRGRASPWQESALQPRDRKALMDAFMDLNERIVVCAPSMPITVLVGPPGCGKTKMIEELVAAARTAVQCRIDCPGHCSPIVRMTLEPEPTPRNFDSAWKVAYAEERMRRTRLIVDPRRTRLVFVDDADHLVNATPRSLGIVLASLRQIATKESVAVVLVGTGQLEALLATQPYADARFRVVRYPAGAEVRNVPAAPWSGLADPEGHDGTGHGDESHLSLPKPRP